MARKLGQDKNDEIYIYIYIYIFIGKKEQDCLKFSLL